MGVYVILDGVRREYPEATHWTSIDDGKGIEIRKRLSRYGFSILAQYGRYDLVGWMEEKGNDA